MGSRQVLQGTGDRDEGPGTEVITKRRPGRVGGSSVCMGLDRLQPHPPQHPEYHPQVVIPLLRDDEESVEPGV